MFTDPRFGWAVVRSLVFAGGSTIGCFVLGFLLAYLIYRPFRGQAFYYALFILPMLTVPIVIAYTAQMLLDRNGPLNDILSPLSGHRHSSAVAVQPQYRAADRDAARHLELDAVLFHHHARRPVVAAEGAGRGGANPRRFVLAHLLGSAASAAAPRDPAGAGAALSRRDGRLSDHLGAAARRSRHRDRDLGIYIYITTWQDFNVSLGAAQSYITMVMMVVIVLAAIRLLRREKRSLDTMYAKAARDGRARHDQDAKAPRSPRPCATRS